MYVCICRGITDSQVKEAVKNGACCVRTVNQEIGIPVKCGKCCVFMKDVIHEALKNSSPQALDF